MPDNEKIITNLQNLTINKLTKQQYDSIQSPVPTDLYMVVDEDEYTAGNGISISNYQISIKNGNILDCGTSKTVI